MAEHVPDPPLFVLQVASVSYQGLDKLEKGLLECHGTSLVEVNKEKKEVRVRGNVQPLELLEKAHAILGEEAKLCYYNRDPSKIHDFKIESNGKEKEEEKKKEDHYKPYVYKEHKPVNCPTSMSGKEFYDYFRGAGSETHKRNAVPTIHPSAVFPGYSHMVDPFAMFPNHYHSNHFNSSVPMPHSPYPPHFY